MWFRSFIVCLLLATVPALAGEKFWVDASSEFDLDWKIYRPIKKELKNQGFLLHRVLPESADSPHFVREVLSLLYGAVDDFRILGQKEVEWDGRKATLVSFRGEHDEDTLVGRIILAPTDEGTELLFLIRHPEADSSLFESFEEIWKNWPALP